jgi:hypothetical protein
MAKKQEQLLSDIAEILAVQNGVDNVARDQLDNNMYTIDHLNEDFHSVLNEQEKMINLLKNKTSNRDDDLLQSIDNILSTSKKNYAFKNEIIEYTEYDEDFERYIENNRKFAQEHNIDISNPFKNMYSVLQSSFCRARSTAFSNLSRYGSFSESLSPSRYFRKERSSGEISPTVPFVFRKILTEPSSS